MYEVPAVGSGCRGLSFFPEDFVLGGLASIEGHGDLAFSGLPLDHTRLTDWYPARAFAVAVTHGSGVRLWDAKSIVPVGEYHSSGFTGWLHVDPLVEWPEGFVWVRRLVHPGRLCFRRFPTVSTVGAVKEVPRITGTLHVHRVTLRTRLAAQRVVRVVAQLRVALSGVSLGTTSGIVSVRVVAQPLAQPLVRCQWCRPHLNLIRVFHERQWIYRQPVTLCAHVIVAPRRSTTHQSHPTVQPR